jgi:dihydropteroate synthase
VQFPLEVAAMLKDIFKSISIPSIMGILNLTEDSFSDGGRYLSTDSAISYAQELIFAGATILDIGAESTRPGSKEVSAELEWGRIEPVLTKLKQSFPHIQISIDTQKASVARKAIALGADIINDVSALRNDPDMVQVLAEAKDTRLVLMHMQGRPENMQDKPEYQDVVKEVHDFLKERSEYAIMMGIYPQRLILDPGIGFGKNLEHNLKLLSSLDSFNDLNIPLLLGTSRKRFIDEITRSEVHRRIGGTLTTTMLACLSKAQIIRVHDVYEHAQFLKVLAAVAVMGET